MVDFHLTCCVRGQEPVACSSYLNTKEADLQNNFQQDWAPADSSCHKKLQKEVWMLRIITVIVLPSNLKETLCPCKMAGYSNR